MPAMSESRRLLLRVYGDSLSLPRAGDGISYVDTYAERFCDALRQTYPDLEVHLYNRSRAAGTAPLLAAEYRADCNYFGAKLEQVIVIQCGICDCAPRPLPPRLRRLVNVLPSIVRAPIIGYLHHNRRHLLRTGLVWREIDPEIFRDTFRRWVASAAREALVVLVVNIAPTTPDIEAHSPGLGTSIELYNALIAEAVATTHEGNVVLVDAHAEVLAAPDGVAAYLNARDGHHITLAAHGLYSRLLVAACGTVFASSVAVATGEG